MVETFTQIKSGIMISVDVTVKILKNGNESGKYVGSVTDYPVITCEEIVDTTYFNKSCSNKK